jgi:hypothetical protein
LIGLFESFLRRRIAGIDVGMRTFGQPVEGGLDVFGIRASCETKILVKIAHADFLARFALDAGYLRYIGSKSSVCVLYLTRAPKAISCSLNYRLKVR